MQPIKKMDLTTGPVLPSIIKVAIPTLMLSLIQMTYNLADLFWVGRVGQIGLDPLKPLLLWERWAISLGLALG